MASTTASDEFISAEDVTVSPRGRKVELNPALQATFTKLPQGKAALLRNSIGSVPKEKRATVSQVIRKNWAHARPGTACRIDFTPDGIPQVREKVAKA